MGKEEKYYKKTVIVNANKLVLFSLDGNTWSSRKEELKLIKARFEEQRTKVGEQLTKGAQFGKKNKNDSEIEQKDTVNLSSKIEKATSKKFNSKVLPTPKKRASSVQKKKVAKKKKAA